MQSNALLSEWALITTVAGSPQYISVKGYSRFAVWVDVDSTSSSNVDAFAILQATGTNGAGAKSTTLLAATVVTANKYYVLEVDPASLDHKNGFDYLGVSWGADSGNVNSAVYVQWPAEFAKTP